MGRKDPGLLSAQTMYTSSFPDTSISGTPESPLLLLRFITLPNVASTFVLLRYRTSECMVLSSSGTLPMVSSYTR